MENKELELLIIAMYSIYNCSVDDIANTYNLSNNEVVEILNKYDDVYIDNTNYKNMFSLY